MLFHLGLPRRSHLGGAKDLAVRELSDALMSMTMNEIWKVRKYSSGQFACAISPAKRAFKTPTTF